MKDKSQLESQYERTIEPVIDKVDASNWDKAQGMTIGAAGLSTAIVFLLTQIGIENNTPLREGLNNSPVLGDNSAPRLGR